MTEEIETQENNKLPVLRGELALLVVVLINSLGVVLMLYSGSGISAISSVPYAFSEVFNKISLGTWTYIFQGLLVLSLMIMRKKFVAPYLFSFVVGFAFSEMLDVHEMWIGVLPTAIGYRVLYFIISYLLLCIGIALSNRCGLPIIPTDLFPRELSAIKNFKYSKVKIKKWLDTPNLKTYEKYIADWHFFLKDLQEYVTNLAFDSSANSDGTARTISMHVLTQFYLTPYPEDGDFYSEFYKRLEKSRLFTQSIGI